MPEWPERIEYHTDARGFIVSEYPVLWDELVSYERARAEAAIERLKLAVEVMRQYGGIGSDDGPMALVGKPAREALSTIGDIP